MDLLKTQETTKVTDRLFEAARNLGNRALAYIDNPYDHEGNASTIFRSVAHNPAPILDGDMFAETVSVPVPQRAANSRAPKATYSIKSF